jgi:prepilin-type N-terminal cleavage/methylation domain-containing protein
VVRNRQRKQPERGFTLIELLAVLVIVGLVIGFTIPAITNLSRSTALPGAIRLVANEASLARQYAITHRVNAELRVANSWDAISVFIYTNVSSSPLPVPVQIDKWNYLPAGTIVYSNSVRSLFFTPTGGTTSNSEVTLCVREGSFDTNFAFPLYYGINSNCGTVTINNLVGRIAILRP